MKSLFCCILLAGACVTGAAHPLLSVTGDEIPRRNIPTQKADTTQDAIFAEATAGGSIDFNIFGKYACDDAYYEELSTRFEQGDTTLLKSDLCILYYGFAFRDEYTGGYERAPGSDLMDAGEYEKAYEVITERLKTNPAAPYLLYSAIAASYMSNHSTQEIEQLRGRMLAILSLIEETGNGSRKSPFVILSVPDEYLFMRIQMGILQINEQNIIHRKDRSYDWFSIGPDNKGRFKKNDIWFDIAFPLSALAKQYQK